MEGVGHLLKEVPHYILFSLSTGIDKEQTKEVGLQSVHGHHRVVRQSAKETLVEVDPERLK